MDNDNIPMSSFENITNDNINACTDIRLFY